MTCCPARLLQNTVEPVIHLASQRRNRAPSNFSHGEKIGRELVAHWNHEKFSRILRLALRVLDHDCFPVEIHALPWDAGLGKPAPEMNQNLKGDAHPSRISSKRGPRSRDILIAEILFFLRGSEFNSRQTDDITNGVFPPNRLPNQKRQKFDFQPGRIVFSAILFSPCHILAGMFVFYLHRMSHPLRAKPFIQSLPDVFISQSGTLIAIMRSDVSWNPCGKLLPFCGTDKRLVRSSLHYLPSGRPGILIVIMPQLEAFILPPSRLHIAKPDIPVRRPRELSQRSHIFNCSPRFPMRQVILTRLNICAHRKTFMKPSIKSLPLHHEAMRVGKDACFGGRAQRKNSVYSMEIRFLARVRPVTRA